MNDTVLNITIPGLKSYQVQEAIKVIRTNLEFCGRDIKVIAVTSYGENEGKTTVSSLVAKSFSELDKKVLFIDADMRKSVFSGRNTDATNYTGLSEVLNGLKTLDECVHETNFPGLYILQAGKYPPNPVELLSSQYFEELITAMRDHFDYIIVDTPPLGYTIDCAVISTVVDGVVIVMGNQDLKRRQAKEVLSQLQKSSVRILGVIRNFVSGKNKKYYKYYRKTKSGYGYGHSYGYGKEYGYGYGYGYGKNSSESTSDKK